MDLAIEAAPADPGDTGESIDGYTSDYGGGGGGAGGWPNGSGGGGGYGTVGATGTGGKDGDGGSVYGDPALSELYLGSGGGGQGGKSNDNGDDWGDPGGTGGGAVFITANSINFAGQIQANAGNGSGNGSGGSILIKANTVSSATLSATASGGGVNGGVGRVAIYYQGAHSGVSGTPQATFIDLYATPTPIPSPTSISFATPNPNGTGQDGNLTIAAASSFNIHTQTQSQTRICYDGGDGVSYAVADLFASSAKLTASPSLGCLKDGDEVLLINLRGTSANHINTGKYEFLKVAVVIDDIVYFKTSKTNYYGDGATDDTNIGTLASEQHVAIYRVPNYEDVTINGTLTGNAWTVKDGLIVFRVAGTLEATGAGIIDLNGRGYAGGVSTNDGEGPAGYDTTVGSGGGAGILGMGNGCPQGGGAGYLTNGGQGAGGRDGIGGTAFGDPKLNQITFGPGGGGNGQSTQQDGSHEDCDPGGRGGGALYIIGNTITLSSVTINAKGIAGGGGGAGGTVRLEGNAVSLGTVNLGSNSNGSQGRLAVYYQTSFSGSYSPIYVQQGSTADTIFNADFETADLSQWTSNTNDSGDLSASNAADYWGLQGMKAVVNDNNAIYVQDDTPNNETKYRTRFYFHPNSVTMATGDVLDLFTGRNGTTDVVRIQLQKTATSYQIRAGLLNDAGTWTDTSWYDAELVEASNAWTAIEIDYDAFASTGSLTLWLDGVQKQALTTIDNDTRTLTDVRLGVQGVETGTRGMVYFDDFDSRRLSYIGTLTDPGVDDPQGTDPAGWFTRTYQYSATMPHAVSNVSPETGSPDTYTYDANGNMICRVEDGFGYTHTYNAENRISSIAQRSTNCEGAILKSWSYAYDGDGVRIGTAYFPGTEPNLTSFPGTNPVPASLSLYYMGGQYEITNGFVKKYYSVAGMTIAMYDEENDELQYLLTDHLGSVAAVVDSGGSLTSQQRYKPFGEARTDVDSPFASPTDFTYTGQRMLDSGMGDLMDYKARFYSPALGRFIQADTIIPDQSNPQSWNRFSYVQNSPIGYSDPTGHSMWDGGGDGGGGSDDDDDDELGGEPTDPDDPADPDDPDDELKTDGLVDFCIRHPYDPSCAKFLPPETCTSYTVYSLPGEAPNLSGCRYVGTRTYNDWNKVDKVGLFFNGLGVFGGLALFIGAIGVIGVGAGIAIYEATQLAGFAYDVYTMDAEALTVDVVLQVAGETHLFEKMIPGIGSALDLLDVADIFAAVDTTVPVYEPYPRPFPLPDYMYK